MEIRVTVVGAGSWGTTVAALTAKNTPTTLWARDAAVAEQIASERCNGRYLPNYTLPASLQCTADLEVAVRDADVIVMGVPSQGFRAAVRDVAAWVRPWVPVVSLTKGLEVDTRLRMSQVAAQELPGHPVAVLTGPNLAKEILAGDAAASVLAIEDQHVASALQPLFSGDLFRVYTHHDVIGCEIGGVLKNVIAIASGMADGLGTGDNTRAMVITRGLAEMIRFGSALGGEEATFSGLAGMGDLMATCISPQSRNRSVGEQLGRGRSIAAIIDDMRMVAEGVKTSKVVHEMAGEMGLEMPICEEVYAACHEGRPATDAYRGLLNRQVGHERAEPVRASGTE
ncbi:MAG TPA: NAD(P)H-dependent glycerol-3-phosphate dehydrogenase [Acidimicrobiales bacterium]|nr:NAD(P)H-dependent glycerol-3-phosphate dehydrogenase [Acidimicrobiales bacterium]